MPKSKNRRKSKSTSASSASTTSAVSTASEASETRASADSDAGSRPKVGAFQFFRQVREEAQKVTWTSRNETMISTIMVLIMVAIASVFFLLVDQVLTMIVEPALG